MKTIVRYCIILYMWGNTPHVGGGGEFFNSVTLKKYASKYAKLMTEPSDNLNEI